MPMTAPTVRQSRRGLAMLLVIISLMMATILTTAYLASRDNSDLVGVNAGGAASARAAAMTGLDVAVALMQTKTAWRTADPLGVLVDDFPVPGGSVDVKAIDEITGQPPTGTTEFLLLTAIAAIGGVQETATARVYAPLISGDTVDVDLSEFAVFAGSKLDMANRATITRWPNSPLGDLGNRIAIGTRATSAASVLLADSAAAIDATVFSGPGASASLVSVNAGPAINTRLLLDAIPVPAPPDVGEPSLVLLPLPLNSTQDGGTSTVNSNKRYSVAELKNNAVRTILGNVKVITERDFKINSGAKLLINGNVKMAVFGSLLIDQGAIELKPNATLELFVRGEGGTAVEVDDGYIGDERTNTVRDASGNANYFNPARISIYSMPPALLGSNLPWLVEDNSVIKASIYSPHASSVTIQEQSAIYGRIATKILLMRDDAAVFYDPLLNSRTGYATTSSRLFDGGGRLLSAFASLASLDGLTLQAAADSSLLKVLNGATTYTPTSATTTEETSVPPSTPTPRPMPVQFQLLTVGGDMHAWESSNAYEG